MMNRFLLSFYSTLLLTGAAGLSAQEKPSSPAEQMQSEKRLRILGYLEPYRSIDITSPERGLIGEIHIEEGQSVKAGEALITLDNRVQEAQLKIAVAQSESLAQIKIAKSELNLAGDKYDKLTRLKKQGTAHSSEVTRAAANMKIAEGNLQLAEEEQKIAALRVGQIRAEIEKRTLRSPIDGVVLEINRDVAESVDQQSGTSTSDRELVLVRVAKLDLLYLVIHLPAGPARHLKKGDRFPVQILLENELNKTNNDAAIKTVGEIEFISPAIDPSSETVRTRLLIQNRDGKIRSGSHAVAIITATPTS